MKDKKLSRATFNFHYACYDKLIKKEYLGWRGWNDPDNREILEERLKKHFNREWTQENLVDIANFCNFLWNLIQADKEINHEKENL